MTWDGVDKRKHETMLPECVEIFRRIEEKVDSLIQRADKINGRYEKHLEESVGRIAQIERHDESLKNLIGIKVWGRGLLTTIAIGAVSSILGYGMLMNQVRIDSVKINDLEHWRTNIDVRKSELGVEK